MTAGAGALQPRSPEARALLKALLEAFPPGATGSTELPVLARRSGLDEERVKHALGLLERAGAVVVRRPFAGRAIAVHDNAAWSALGVDLSKVRAQERNNLLLLKRMTDYAYAKRCRRAYLLRYFGDHTAQANCGACDVCVGARLKLSTATASSAPRAAPSLSPHASLTYSELAAEELKRWRKELSKDLDIPPYIIFNDATLYGLAAALPTTEEEFLAVKGTGPARWERFGVKVTELCLLARAAGGVPQPAPARRRRR
jgi:ATP-dependent DNA helicase RecQ